MAMVMDDLPHRFRPVVRLQIAQRSPSNLICPQGPQAGRL
jgi:hypothetical protein